MESRIDSDSDFLQKALTARLLEVAFHESFYEVKAKIDLLESSNKSINEKNEEKQYLARIMSSVFVMKTDVDKMLYGANYNQLSPISQKVIDIEVKKYLDSGMSVSQLKQSLDDRISKNRLTSRL